MNPIWLSGMFVVVLFDRGGSVMSLCLSSSPWKKNSCRICMVNNCCKCQGFAAFEMSAACNTKAKRLFLSKGARSVLSGLFSYSDHCSGVITASAVLMLFTWSKCFDKSVCRIISEKGRVSYRLLFALYSLPLTSSWKYLNCSVSSFASMLQSFSFNVFHVVAKWWFSNTDSFLYNWKNFSLKNFSRTRVIYLSKLAFGIFMKVVGGAGVLDIVASGSEEDR